MKEINGATRLICLLGNPVAHSKSPYMYNLSFEELKLDYSYMAFNIERGSIGEALDAMKLLNVRGFNLTMPFKEDVLEDLDKIDKSAGFIGSVNTVLNKEGKLIGYNTDGKGFIESLEKRKVQYKDKKITILGGGGAARAIAIELALKGAGEIVIANRTLEAAEEIKEIIDKNIRGVTCKSLELKEELVEREVKDSHILINTTSLGMDSSIHKSPIENKNTFHRDLFVADVIYYPLETKFLSLAKERGCERMNGLDMLIYQGSLALEIWTNKKMPRSVIESMQNEVIF